MKSLLVFELFTALEQQDFDLTLSKLERLHEIDLNVELFRSLIREQKESIAIEKAEGLLSRHRYDQAVNAVNDVILAEGISARLTEEKNKLLGFTRVYRYINENNLEDAENAANAFSGLPAPGFFDHKSSDYERWYRQQNDNVARIVKANTIRLVRELMYEMDIALATSSEVYSVLEAQMGIILTDYVNDDRWLRLLNGQIDLSSILPVIPDNAKDPQLLAEFPFLALGFEGMSFDFSLSKVYEQTSLKTREQIRRYLISQPPSSFTGARHRIRNRMQSGQYIRAFHEISALSSYLPNFDNRDSAVEFYENYLKDETMQTSPTVSGFLSHLYRLQ